MGVLSLSAGCRIEAARCALVPEAFAAPAPIYGLAQRDRLRERLGVHVGMHEYFAGREVRGNYGDQPVLIELGGQFDSFLDLLDALSFRKGRNTHLFSCWLCGSALRR